MRVLRGSLISQRGPQNSYGIRDRGPQNFMTPFQIASQHISCEGASNDIKVLRPISSGRIVPFQIASQLQCAASGFKQVEIAYLAAVSYLDKLVQPSHMLCTQFKPLALPRVC